MVGVLFVIILLFGLIWASYYDLKSREIPDLLSYSLIAGCLGISLIYSLFASFNFFLSSILGGIIVFSLGYIFYYFKQIGGGDVKIFTSIGIALSNFYVGKISLLIIFGGIILIVGGIYSLIWGINLFLKNRKQSFTELSKSLNKKRTIRRYIIILSLILVIVGIIAVNLRGLIITLIFLIYGLFYLNIFVKVIEKLHFIKKIKVSELTEGDWLAKDVILNNKKLISKKEPEIEKKHIAILKKYNIHEVWIRIGIPFVPAILITFLLTIIIYGILG